MREFLTDNCSENSTVPEVELKVMLANQTCVTVMIERNEQTEQVLTSLLESLQIPANLASSFGIFETVENNFGEINCFSKKFSS